MAHSVLVIYEPLEEIIENKNYWKEYIEFYEKYWDGPSSFQSIWFGREYDDFRDGLSNHLVLDKEFIEDCFFMKDKDERYYISPLTAKSNPYVFSSENYIPPEWFMLFSPEDKKLSYTHTGYGAISQDGIYYTTEALEALNNINMAEDIIEHSFIVLGNDKSTVYNPLKQISDGIKHIKSWISGFNQRGKLVLNYGDICTYIPNYSLTNENSVKDIWNILNLIRNKAFSDAESKLYIFVVKWKETFGQASRDNNKSVVQ
jgi:hypothetical protein